MKGGGVGRRWRKWEDWEDEKEEELELVCKIKIKKSCFKKNLKIVMGFGLLLRRFKNQRTDEIFS